MNNMQQRIYRPPNVAGWEGGMSWLNTNTVQGRFDMIQRAQYLRYSNYYVNTTVPAPPATINYPPDIASETPAAVVERAWQAANRPWISAGTRAAAEAYATAAATNDAARTAPALLRSPGNDARRPRRTGDVRCAASNARRSSSPGSGTSCRARRCRFRTRRSTAFPPAARRAT